jgi:hypothetical protein
MRDSGDSHDCMMIEEECATLRAERDELRTEVKFLAEHLDPVEFAETVPRLKRILARIESRGRTIRCLDCGTPVPIGDSCPDCGLGDDK